jgi:hypothetical protein
MRSIEGRGTASIASRSARRTRAVIITDHETADDLEAAYSGRGGFALSQEVDYATRFGTTFEIVQ